MLPIDDAIKEIVKRYPQVRRNLTAKAHAYFDGGAVKTYEYFLRTLDTSVRNLWNGKISESQFVDGLAGLLEQQMRRAWNEGMRENGLDPTKDMTDQWEQIYQGLVTEQFQYVDQYAADIVAARSREGASIDPFRARVSMWAYNYTSTVNTSKIVTASPEDRFIWKLGRTEQHCETCAALNGVVATAKDWDALRSKGIEPQGDNLMCGGWNCDCTVEITDKPLTKGGIPDVPHK